MKTSEATPFLAAIAALSFVIAVNTIVTACNLSRQIKKNEELNEKNKLKLKKQKV